MKLLMGCISESKCLLRTAPSATDLFYVAAWQRNHREAFLRLFNRRMTFKSFLYSKWFYLTLGIVCIIDLCADLGEHIWGWTDLNFIAIAMDLTAVGLVLWIFIDLHTRRPTNGGDTRR